MHKGFGETKIEGGGFSSSFKDKRNLLTSTNVMVKVKVGDSEIENFGKRQDEIIKYRLFGNLDYKPIVCS